MSRCRLGGGADGRCEAHARAYEAADSERLASGCDHRDNRAIAARYETLSRPARRRRHRRLHVERRD